MYDMFSGICISPALSCRREAWCPNCSWELMFKAWFLSRSRRLNAYLQLHWGGVGSISALLISSSYLKSFLSVQEKRENKNMQWCDNLVSIKPCSWQPAAGHSSLLTHCRIPLLPPTNLLPVLLDISNSFVAMFPLKQSLGKDESFFSDFPLPDQCYQILVSWFVCLF